MDSGCVTIILLFTFTYISCENGLGSSFPAPISHWNFDQEIVFDQVSLIAGEFIGTARNLNGLLNSQGAYENSNTAKEPKCFNTFVHNIEILSNVFLSKSTTVNLMLRNFL